MAKRNPHLHKRLQKEVLADPEMRAEYETFSLQLKLAEQMKKVRQKAHLTQEAVAKKMHTQKTVVARLEAAGGRGKHSPSLSTLAKYASAIGCKLQVKLIPANQA